MAHADSDRSVATITRQTACRQARSTKDFERYLAQRALDRLIREHAPSKAGE